MAALLEGVVALQVVGTHEPDREEHLAAAEVPKIHPRTPSSQGRSQLVSPLSVHLEREPVRHCVEDNPGTPDWAFLFLDLVQGRPREAYTSDAAGQD